jgi:hypothetical protein
MPLLMTLLIYAATLTTQDAHPARGSGPDA